MTATEIARHFPSTELALIGDEVADGLWEPSLATTRPRPFDGLRTDFSLARLNHSTWARQRTIPSSTSCSTNHHRYVDEFVRWAAAQLAGDGPYTALSCAGHVLITKETPDPEKAISDAAWRRH